MTAELELAPVRDAVTRLTVLKVLKDRIGAAYETTRAETAELLAAGDRITATVDGQRIGSVTAVAGSVRARVVDERAFTAWVAARHPDEVVTSVRESFREALLRRLTANAAPGDPPADPGTGELIPGIVLVASAGYLRVTPARDAAALLAPRPETVRAALGAALDGGAA